LADELLQYASTSNEKQGFVESLLTARKENTVLGEAGADVENGGNKSDQFLYSLDLIYMF